MRTGFSDRHPAVQLIFFISVLGITMFSLHPIILSVSLLSGMIWLGYSGGIKGLIKALAAAIPAGLLVMIINPLVSHQGIHIIWYLPDGNPVTQEALLFGFAAAVLMSAVIIWFIPLHRIFTSDRILYLLGRFTPGLALLFSLTMRFVTRFGERFRMTMAVNRVQRQARRLRLNDLKKLIGVISSVLQWALENSIDTADSMNSRGYGLCRRSFCHRFIFRAADSILISTIIILDILIVIFSYPDLLSFSYYPYIDIPGSTPCALAMYGCFLVQCLLPLITDITEDIKWSTIQSEI